MTTSVSFNVKQFTTALKYIAKFSHNSGRYSPLLGYVKITTTYIEYVGYNNYAKIPVQPINSTGDFNTVIQISQLANTLKNAKGKGDFTLATSVDGVTVNVGGAAYKVSHGNMSEWERDIVGAFSPNLSQSNTSICCNFALIDECLPFATVNDDTRPALNGVFVDKANSSLVASDGFRLIAVKLGTDPFKFYTSNESLLIPSDLLKAVKGIDGVVEVFKSPLRGDVCWVTILSQGAVFSWHGLQDVNYPNYASLIPSKFEYKFKFATDITPLLKGSIPSSILTFTGSTMQVETYDSHLNVKNKNMVGSQTVNVVTSYPNHSSIKGKPLQVGLNPKFLQEALAVCPKGDYNISLNASPSGVVVSPIKIENTSQHNDVIVLVMPMGLS